MTTRKVLKIIFFTADNKKLHSIEEHVPETSLECGQCGELFIGKNSLYNLYRLKQHQQDKHSPKELTCYRCYKCCKKYTGTRPLYHLKYHMAQKHSLLADVKPKSSQGEVDALYRDQEVKNLCLKLRDDLPLGSNDVIMRGVYM